MSDGIKKNAEDIIGTEAGVDVLSDGSPVGEAGTNAIAPVDPGEVAVESVPGKKKGVIAAVIAVAVVAVVGIGAAFALQPASSGDPSGSTTSSAAAAGSASSSGSSSSASSSKSSASVSSSSTAVSSDSSSSASSSGAAKSEGSSGSGDATSGSGNAATGSGSTAAGGTAGAAGTATPSGGNNASSGNTSNAGGGTASTSSHTHNWVPITEPQIITDQEEQRIPVTKYGVGDGSVFDSLNEAEDYAESIALSGGPNYGVGSFVEYEVIPGESHTEDVVVGYRCSECGATK